MDSLTFLKAILTIGFFLFVQLISVKKVVKRLSFGLEGEKIWLVSIPMGILGAVFVSIPIILYNKSLLLLLLFFQLTVFIFQTYQFIKTRPLINNLKLKNTHCILFLFATLQFSLTLYFFRNQSLPLFIDSIRHHEYIKLLLGSESHKVLGLNVQLPGLLYHFGYHVLISTLTFVSKIPPHYLMVASGLFIVAIFPISLYYLTGSYTKFELTNLLATLLFVSISKFPSFGLNWGKYPAIMSITVLPVLLSFILQFINYDSKSHKKVNALILFLLMILETFVHTRSLIIIGSFTLACLIYTKLLKKKCSLILTIVLLLLLSFVLFINFQNTSTIQYSEIIIFLLLAVSCGVAIWKSVVGGENKLVLPIVFLIIIASFSKIPIPLRLNLSPNLINHEYFLLTFPIPLAMLFVASANEMSCLVPKKSPDYERILVIFFLILILLATPWQVKTNPVDKYVLVGTDQIKSFVWLKNNFKPGETKILIAGMAEFDYLEYADSGGWIYTLTGLETVKVPPLLDFNSIEQAQKLCETDIDMIYLDSTKKDRGFGKQKIDLNLYSVLFESGNVRIIQPVCIR